MMERREAHMSWHLADGIVELALHREPCNEIGTAALEHLERFIEWLDGQRSAIAAIIIHSPLASGFCAGADLRELHARGQEVSPAERGPQVRAFLERIHAVLNALDHFPATTLAAVHRFTFGGGFELALACDLIIADKNTRFCFPELRLGLVPGFGGIPRLNRDLGNAVVRDILLTGRSVGARRAYEVGLVSQLAGSGQALDLARRTAAQIVKFDRHTAAAAKAFIKPQPHAALRREIDLFCELFERPAVQSGLDKFVHDSSAHAYLP